MKDRLFFGVNIILSVVLLVGFVIFTVKDILTVGNSYFWLICYSCPFLFAILFGISSLLYKPSKSSKLQYIPLGINIMTIVAGIGLFTFADMNPDFSFLRHFEDYTSAAQLIESGQLNIDETGFAQLPDQLAHTSLTGFVYVIQEAEVTTIYFLYDAETFDGYSWGYLYRSDGSEPESYDVNDREKQDKCYRWRPIESSTPNWFYCEAHGKFVFPGW